MTSGIREWARRQGYEVGSRGRLSPQIMAAYAEAHGQFVAPEEDGPSCPCGRRWGRKAYAEAHCPTCHAHFSTVGNFDLHRPYGRCLHPEAVLDKHGQPKLRAKQTVWGPLYVGAGEYPREIHEEA